MKHWNGIEETIYANAENGLICPWISPETPYRWLLPSIGEAYTHTQISTYEICRDHEGKHTQYSLDLAKELAEYGSDTDS